MKIPRRERRPSRERSRAMPRRSAAATSGSAKPASADDGHAPAGAAERDFASVLDELARADEISYRGDESGSRERDGDFDVRRGDREAERGATTNAMMRTKVASTGAAIAAPGGA